MSALRMVFLSEAGMVLLGIWLTGFDKAHWILYLMVAGLSFAGVTGICPSLLFWKKMDFRNECAIPDKNN